MKMVCSSASDSYEVGTRECPVIARLNHADVGVSGSTTSVRLRHMGIGGSEDLKENGLSISAEDYLRLRLTSRNASERFGVSESVCNNNNDCNANVSYGDKGVESICNNYYLKENSVGDFNYEKLSPRLKELLEGLNEPGDSSNQPVQPEWLDRELFDRGRSFYQKFLFCIFFSDLLSLLMAFSMNRIIKPLIYTDKSDTPTRALRRYVSTIMHIITWFSGDVWDPNDRAHKDILHVRNIHNNAAGIFNSSENYNEVQRTNVRSKGHVEPKCPFSPSLRQDLQMQAEPGICLESPANPPLYISQWDMVLTQYCFLGIMLAHPRSMGAWGATERDLEGFVHFWRGIGWLLGIEDKYNFCKGTAAETKALCAEIERLVIIPNLSRSGWNQEHMSSSLMDGINMMVPGLSYPAMLRFLADTLGLSVPLFVRNMSLRHIVQYWLMYFVFHFVFMIPGVVYFFNGLLRYALRRIQRIHPSWFPESRKVIFADT
ncbi:uncharacterized protein [Palaemon carinicauda]|uniref:uncharacterized protein n=1 Tax=Palaemon carinicauda TaxID=392227 RepID=UPI0035B61F81